ncbi:MAG: glucose-6-phosphate isomerase [Firmicutes bacterium]|nr:glucose-6-phosphate isomerase [Bacillota bacterium]
MDVNVNLEGLPLGEERINGRKPDAAAALDRLWSGQVPMTGWVKAPMETDQEALNYLLDVADIIKAEAELLVVLGIGGSYMGAKAAIEALPKQAGGIEVRFLGINFCTDYYREVLEEIKRKNTIVCVISKSGNTMEVRTALEVVRPIMEEKYGGREAASRRIIAITDPVSGTLREEANERDYVTFEVPGDIGGRYSMMTPAGLLPMAVSGIDVRELLRGAEVMATSPAWDSYGTEYAIARYLMHTEEGKAIESIAFSHSRMGYFGEWLKQLFGESEGKEGKGLWPATLQFSTDLHSMGQFLQQGSPVFFETMVIIDEYEDEIIVPAGPVAGMSLEELNDAMMDGVIKAHRDGGVPVIEIHIPMLTPFYFGQLVYFMETSCAVTAMLMGVDPFNQPGVEDYKREMRRNCGMED